MNRPDRGNKLIHIKNEHESNCEKLMKWLRGMCDKCFWWAKRQADEVGPYDIAKALIDR